MFEDDFALILLAGEADDLYSVASRSYRPEYVDTVRDTLRRYPTGRYRDAYPQLRIRGRHARPWAASRRVVEPVPRGKDINENRDGWIQLGSRLARAVSELTRRLAVTHVSEPAAFAIALAAVAEREPAMPRIVVLAKATATVRNRSLTPEAHRQFLPHPDGYYVFTVEFPGRNAHVIAVSSTADVLFHHVLTTAPPA